MYEDNNKSYSITAEQQKEVELRQEKEFVVYYLRKALVMVGDMAISEAIEHLEHIGEKYKKDKEYNEFVSKCSNNGFENIKWSEIPDIARDELMLMYRGLVCGLNNVTEDDHDYYFGKATTMFKDKYNIKKIEI